MSPRRVQPLLASDGLLARDSGEWARDKLSFLEYYVPPALQATKTKLQRYYVDLFAGPGRNIERGTGEEFPGSPVMALTMHASVDTDVAFTHAIFVNHNMEESDALQERVRRLSDEGRCRVPRSGITFYVGDANDYIDTIMRSIHPLAYLLVFADIERLKHWPMTSVRALSARGHRSLDLCMLFPLHMAITRLISYSGTHTHSDALTDFFGTSEWQGLASRRYTDAQSPQLRRDLETLYLAQLSPSPWVHAAAVKDVYYRGRRMLYRLLFVSNHVAGKKISAWAKKHGDTDEQLALL